MSSVVDEDDGDDGEGEQARPQDRGKGEGVNSESNQPIVDRAEKVRGNAGVGRVEVDVMGAYRCLDRFVETFFPALFMDSQFEGLRCILQLFRVLLL